MLQHSNRGLQKPVLASRDDHRHDPHLDPLTTLTQLLECRLGNMYVGIKARFYELGTVVESRKAQRRRVVVSFDEDGPRLDVHTCMTDM